jgi:hypothetical protein
MTENPDYWTSPEGLFKRIDMLTQDWTYRTYNGAVQLIGLVNEVEGFEWEGSIDERTCNKCDMNIGRQYKLGQFMPTLPVHNFCRCSWRVIAR